MQVLRMPRMRDHVEEFISYSMANVLKNMQMFDVIDDYCFVCPRSQNFIKGIDLHLFIDERILPVQITDNPDIARAFSEQDILIIFIPEKDDNGKVLSIEEKQTIMINEMARELRRVNAWPRFPRGF